jgi:hypothetical protein
VTTLLSSFFPCLNAEMKEMMGGQDRTVNVRNKLIKGKLGAFAGSQIRIQKRKDAEAAVKAQHDAAAAKPAPVKKTVAQSTAPVLHEEPLILRGKSPAGKSRLAPGI